MNRRRTGTPSSVVGKALVAAVLAAGLLGVAGCGGTDSATQPGGAPARSADDAAIRDLLNRYIAAWNAGDGKAFGATYAPAATHVTFNGALLTGQPAITGTHSQLFDTFLRGSRIELHVDGLRFLTDDVAVLHTSGGILEAGDSALSDDRRSMNTMVVTRHAGGWLVETVQVTRIDQSIPG